MAERSAFAVASDGSKVAIQAESIDIEIREGVTISVLLNDDARGLVVGSWPENETDANVLVVRPGAANVVSINVEPSQTTTTRAE
ncbi:MAG: hypothetical protein ABJN26_10290 [Stappiaceae bacterium]